MNIADPPHELRLISNPVLRVSLSDFEVPLKTGRLKANYASCLSRRRKLEAAVRNPSRGKAHSCNHEHRGSPPLFNDKFISSESSIFYHLSLSAMEKRDHPATDPSGDPARPPAKVSLSAKRGSVPVIRVSPAPPPMEILLCRNRTQEQQQQRRGSMGEPAGERGER